MPTAEGQGLTVRKRLQGNIFSLNHDCPGHTMRASWNSEKLKYAKYSFVRQESLFQAEITQRVSCSGQINILEIIKQV